MDDFPAHLISINLKDFTYMGGTTWTKQNGPMPASYVRGTDFESWTFEKDDDHQDTYHPKHYSKKWNGYFHETSKSWDVTKFTTSIDDADFELPLSCK